MLDGLGSENQQLDEYFTSVVKQTAVSDTGRRGCIVLEHVADTNRKYIRLAKRRNFQPMMYFWK